LRYGTCTGWNGHVSWGVATPAYEGILASSEQVFHACANAIVGTAIGEAAKHIRLQAQILIQLVIPVCRDFTLRAAVGGDLLVVVVIHADVIVMAQLVAKANVGVEAVLQLDVWRAAVFHPAHATERGPIAVDLIRLVTKYLITAAVVVAVSELAERSDRLGALLASLPLVTLLALTWLYVEKQPASKITDHAWYTFWYVVPTLPMFLAFPRLFTRFGFWPAPGLSAVITIVSFALFAWAVRPFGIKLM